MSSTAFEGPATSHRASSGTSPLSGTKHDRAAQHRESDDREVGVQDGCECSEHRDGPVAESLPYGR
jgi:hypothetical protein